MNTVIIVGLGLELRDLSYNELFEQYQAAVAAQRHATPLDAARIEVNIITPLNEELTRRSQDHLTPTPGE